MESPTRTSVPMYFFNLEDGVASESLNSWMVDSTQSSQSATGHIHRSSVATSSDGPCVVAMLERLMQFDNASQKRRHSSEIHETNNPFDVPLGSCEAVAHTILAEHGLRPKARISFEIMSQFPRDSTSTGSTPQSPSYLQKHASGESIRAIYPEASESSIPSTIRHMHLQEQKPGVILAALDCFKAHLGLDTSTSDASESTSGAVPLHHAKDHNPHVAYSMQLHELKVCKSLRSSVRVCDRQCFCFQNHTLLFFGIL